MRYGQRLLTFVGLTGALMRTPLVALLTVGSVAIPAVLAVAFVVSPSWALALAAVSALAFVGTAMTLGPRRTWQGAQGTPWEVRDGSVSPLLLLVVLEVVLATCRYQGHLPEVLAATVPDAFATGFVLTDPTWLVAFVIAPVSLMLLGAHFLTRRTSLGLYMAWWSGLYAMADGLAQVRILILPGALSIAQGVGSVVAMALMLVAVRLGQQLLRPGAPPAEDVGENAGLTARQRNLWSLLFVCCVVVYGATLFVQAGPLPVGIIVGSMMGGLMGWRNTTALRPADPAKAVPLFVLLLSLFYVHVGEEALTDFNNAIAAISGTPWDNREFTLLIALLGPIVWFAAALSLWHRQPFGNFIFWFLIVGMILGEPTHLLVFPAVAMHKFGVGYGYFSGMYTALFPMVPALLALVMLVGDHRRAVRAQG